MMHVNLCTKLLMHVYVFVYLFQERSTFLAGDALRSANKFKALNETALFGYSCCHDFPGQFISLKHGER